MAPDGKVDDGLFNLCMPVKHISRLNMVKLMLQYTKGTQAANPVVETAESAGFIVEAVSGSLICHADGETICTAGKKLKVECIPSALQIYSRGGSN